MNNELLPCPFCGDDEIMDFQAHLENRVQCAMCNVSTDTFPSCEESHAAWNTRTKAAPAEPQSESVIVPDGYRLVAVNGSFSDLMYYLGRASAKGYLDRLYDLVEPWESFDYEYLDNPSAPEQE